jgi:hypothetical protein
MRKLFSIAAPLVCTAGLISGCGTKVIDAGVTEGTISSFVLSHARVHIHDVSCPSGLTATVGMRFDCHFVGPDGHYVAHIHVLKINGTRTNDYIVTQRTS